MNRREALTALPGALAGVIGTDALIAPAADAKVIDEWIEDRLCEKEAIPDGEDPGVHHAIAALYQFLDNADEVLTRHEIEAADGWECDCDFCTDLRGQFYAVQMFATMLDACCFRGGLIWQSRRRFERNTKVRKKFLRDWADLPVGGSLDFPNAIRDLPPLKKPNCCLEYQEYQEGGAR